MEMPQYIDLVKQASSIPLTERCAFLTELPETELQQHLASLFNKAEGSACAEVTHGTSEYGRDIVLRRRDLYGEEYVGIVVKRIPYQRMSGRTAGPIDEAISQAHQAIVHPCPLKEIATTTVNIASVWIALFCRLSNNAMARLTKETEDILGRRILTLELLAELFTEHYPEVFFEGGVSDYLTTKILEFENWEGITTHQEKLTSWFVNPMLGATNAKNAPADESAFRVPDERLPLGRLNEYVRQDSTLILTGDPGSGKSTVLRKVAVDRLIAAHRNTGRAPQSPTRSKNASKLPIPILLNAVSVTEEMTIADLVESQIPPVGPIRDKFKVDLLILDGLDEVPKNGRRPIVDDVINESRKYGCCLIISTRKVPSLQLDVIGQARGAVSILDIQPFQLPQALELVSRISNDSQVAKIVQDGLLRINHQIILTPMTLELLVEVAEAEREIPGSKSEIFDRYTDIALGRYDSQKGIQVAFDFYVKKRFLAKLSWEEFKNKDRTELSKSEFDAFVSQYLAVYGWDSESFDTLIAEIERSGILRIGPSVFFSHRSLLEYFVAWWLVNDNHLANHYAQTVVDLYFDSLWSEVALYAVGHNREASQQLITDIMERPSNGIDDDLMKFMVGRLLQAGWHSTTDIKRDGIVRGISVGKLILEDLDELQAQGDNHIPPIIPLFFLLASGEYSYGSKTLLKEATAILEELPIEPCEEDFYKRLTLLWAIREKVDTSTLRQLTQDATDQLAALEKENALGIEHRLSSLIFLAEIGHDDQSLVRSLRRKAQRLARNNPALRGAMSVATRGRKVSTART